MRAIGFPGRAPPWLRGSILLLCGLCARSALGDTALPSESVLAASLASWSGLTFGATASIGYLHQTALAYYVMPSPATPAASQGTASGGVLGAVTLHVGGVQSWLTRVGSRTTLVGLQYGLSVQGGVAGLTTAPTYTDDEDDDEGGGGGPVLCTTCTSIVRLLRVSLPVGFHFLAPLSSTATDVSGILFEFNYEPSYDFDKGVSPYGLGVRAMYVHLQVGRWTMAPVLEVGAVFTPIGNLFPTQAPYDDRIVFTAGFGLDWLPPLPRTWEPAW